MCVRRQCRSGGSSASAREQVVESLLVDGAAHRENRDRTTSGRGRRRVGRVGRAERETAWCRCRDRSRSTRSALPGEIAQVPRVGVGARRRSTRTRRVFRAFPNRAWSRCPWRAPSSSTRARAGAPRSARPTAGVCRKCACRCDDVARQLGGQHQRLPEAADPVRASVAPQIAPPRGTRGAVPRQPRARGATRARRAPARRAGTREGR